MKKGFSFGERIIILIWELAEFYPDPVTNNILQKGKGK